MKLKVPKTFKDVAVAFSREEWQMLSKEEKQLHQQVMVQNYEHMVSVGYKIPLEELAMLLDPDKRPFSMMEERVTSLQPDPRDVPQAVHRWADCEGRQRSLSEDHMNSEDTKSFTDSMAIAGHEDVLHRNHQSKYMESDMSFTQKNEIKSPLQRHEVKELCSYSNCKQSGTFPFTVRTDVKITQTNKNGFISSHCLNVFRKFRIIKGDKDKDIQVTHQDFFTGEESYKYDPLAKSFIKKDKSVTIQTGERPYNHVACEMSFLQKNNVTLQENIQKTVNLYKCIPCGKSFSSKGSLTNHERIHREDKFYKCATCGKGFARKSNLRKHEGIQSGNKSLICIQYGKSFPRITRFKNHEIIQRDTCGKSFVWKCQLRDHARIHGGDRPHTCDTCDKSFTQKWTIKVHEKTHINSYTCTTCSKSFRWKDQLTVHERRHTGEKPYKCASCDEHFARKDKLIIHERIHSGEKPYKCSICSKTFTRKDRLVAHNKIHKVNAVTVPHVA
ncbi:zinc finger protein 585B-like isoform X2 [Protopterus annectens]|uniref:zinc finger protein 585B-like isoform X2 n=1 Tax=Protopterus annectens TaxID=7888 RepID=UPI001CFA2A09|nr:zinc finger protein 585B-like isoform X2 [Protopterus annectens]